VTLEAGLPRSEIPEALRRCDALVSATVEGSADKAVFEAMATGRPVLVCNPALDFLAGSWPLRLRFDAGDASDLADAIRGLSQAGPADMNAVGRRLGMRPDEEAPTRLLLATLVWHVVDAEVAEKAGELGREWLASHRGIDGADLAIGATAILTATELLTLNIRHYPMFPGLRRPY
jgi:hypothetical protein